MSESNGTTEGSSDIPDAEIEAIYGPDATVAAEGPASLPRIKRTFMAWHHPVKQIVRARQWAKLTGKLLAERRQRLEVLRYFTLPGPDLLDVRVLTEVCSPLEIPIHYFGFNAGAEGLDEPEDQAV